jgi:hypothetical protein
MALTTPQVLQKKKLGVKKNKNKKLQANGPASKNIYKKIYISIPPYRTF